MIIHNAIKNHKDNCEKYETFVPIHISFNMRLTVIVVRPLPSHFRFIGLRTKQTTTSTKELAIKCKYLHNFDYCQGYYKN